MIFGSGVIRKLYIEKHKTIYSLIKKKTCECVKMALV